MSRQEVEFSKTRKSKAWTGYRKCYRWLKGGVSALLVAKPEACSFSSGGWGRWVCGWVKDVMLCLLCSCCFFLSFGPSVGRSIVVAAKTADAAAADTDDAAVVVAAAVAVVYSRHGSQKAV